MSNLDDMDRELGKLIREIFTIDVASLGNSDIFVGLDRAFGYVAGLDNHYEIWVINSIDGSDCVMIDCRRFKGITPFLPETTHVIIITRGTYEEIKPEINRPVFSMNGERIL